MCLISAVLWSLEATFLAFQYITAIRYYRNPPKLDVPPEPILTTAQTAALVNNAAGTAALHA